MTIYVGIGLVLALVAGIVYSAFSKEQATQGISMDDLGTVEVKRTKQTKAKKQVKAAP